MREKRGWFYTGEMGREMGALVVWTVNEEFDWGAGAAID